uniref:RNA helicase n=1 Tax=Anopheles culicifacies TaxID=139723 RepID=A0A182LU52_9DIPT
MSLWTDKTFSDLGLTYWITRQTEKLGLRRPTPIQVECIPRILQGQDCIATLKDFLKTSIVFPIAEDVFEWSEQSQVATVETLDQRYLLCADYDRDTVLVEALRKYREENENACIMIFTNSKKDCQILSISLNSFGFDNVCLHGFLRQKERVTALNKFKSKHVRIMIATDVASRGLDIQDVQLVMNHRLPKKTVEYIHRVGRTARAGRSGMAISILRFPRDLEALGEIEALINTKLTEYSVDDRLVQRIFMQVKVARAEAEMNLDNKDFDERQHKYRRLRWIQDGLDPDEMEAKWKEEMKLREQTRRERLRKENEERRRRDKQALSSPSVTNDSRFKAAAEDKKFKKRKFIAPEKLNELIEKRKSKPEDKTTARGKKKGGKVIKKKSKMAQ